jgi:hypothetical protein
MLYTAKFTIHSSGTLSIDATPYSTVQDAMRSLQKVVQNGVTQNAWVEDAGGSCVADFSEVKDYIATF